MKTIIKSRNKGLNYEYWIFDIINKVIVAVFGKKYSDVKYTPNCRIDGKSGKNYQIDVLGQRRNELFLIECKDFHTELDYKIIAAYIYKCIDISNNYSDKPIYAIIVNRSGFNLGAVRVKVRPEEKWARSKIDFRKKVKMLRINPRIYGKFVVVYEFENGGVSYYPITLSESVDESVETLVLSLQYGEDFVSRISKGFQLLLKLPFSAYRNKPSLERELKILCYENISNSCLHLKEWFDSLFFSNKLNQLARGVKQKEHFYEAEILSAIANYKKLENQNIGRVKKPGFGKIIRLRKLIVEASDMSHTQEISAKLFLGTWLARFDDYKLGVKYILECKEKTSFGNFVGSQYYYFLSLLRLGELEKDEDIAFEFFNQASDLIQHLSPQHKVVGKEVLEYKLSIRKKCSEG